MDGTTRMRTRTTMTTTTIKLNKNMLFHLNWFDLCLYFFLLLLLCIVSIRIKLHFEWENLVFPRHKTISNLNLNWIEKLLFLVRGQLIIFTTQDKLCCHKIYLHTNLSFEFWQQNGVGLHQCQFVNIKLNLSRHIHHHKTFLTLDLWCLFRCVWVCVGVPD